MDSIRIVGGQRLSGDIPISGAKNAALPLMAACILCEDPVRLSRCPDLADVGTLAALLRSLGCEVSCHQGVCEIHAQQLTSSLAHYDLVRKMRASVLVLGPLLARVGEASVSLPGGCAIGTRPVDLHISALREMGATINIVDGYVQARAPLGGLRGARIRFPKISVGATENVLMAATRAKGRTVLENCAREPEVDDLITLLMRMGAKITRRGTEIEIEGVTTLRGATHSIIADRIEAGSYAVAAAATGGHVRLKNFSTQLLPSFTEKLRYARVQVEDADNDVEVFSKGPEYLRPTNIRTEPYPGFPTDLQAQFLTLMTLVQGTSEIYEDIFENRFMHVPELMRMGANLTQDGNHIAVRGVPQLTGAQVMATDLRASFSLVIAGLVARKETIVNRIYHLDRGYEDIENKFKGCNAIIERVEGHHDTRERRQQAAS